MKKGDVIGVRTPGKTRIGKRIRLDEDPQYRANGWVKLRGWRVRKDGVMLNWTSAYVPVEYATVIVSADE